MFPYIGWIPSVCICGVVLQKIRAYQVECSRASEAVIANSVRTVLRIFFWRAWFELNFLAGLIWFQSLQFGRSKNTNVQFAPLSSCHVVGDGKVGSLIRFLQLSIRIGITFLTEVGRPQSLHRPAEVRGAAPDGADDLRLQLLPRLGEVHEVYRVRPGSGRWLGFRMFNHGCRNRGWKCGFVCSQILDLWANPQKWGFYFKSSILQRQSISWRAVSVDMFTDLKVY